MADESKSPAQIAYESAPGALYKLIPWSSLNSYWQTYWTQRAAGAL